MEEEIISTEPVFTQKFAVLPTIEAYSTLNDTIGDSYGFPRFGTSFYSDPQPLPGWDEKYYMVITTDVQQYHADCLTGIELIDTIPVEIIDQIETI